MARKKKPEIKVGTKFHWYDRDLWHIINIFEHDGHTMVVLKSWAKYKNRWTFAVSYRENIEWFLNSQLYDEINK